MSRKNCGPRRARTVDPRIKSPLLYRLSYRPHCTLNYWALRLLISCGSNRIGDLRPLRQTLNQSRGGFSLETECEGKAPMPEARQRRRCRSRLNPTNLRRSKHSMQRVRICQMQTTMKSQPEVELAHREPNDGTNDLYRQLTVTNRGQDVRKPQHMYQVKELLATSRELQVIAMSV